jgi:hypothetical protein
VACAPAVMTNTALFARVAPITQALRAEVWTTVVARSSAALDKNAAQLHMPLLDAVPLGYYLNLWQGQALRHAGNAVIDAPSALRAAEAWLYQGDRNMACSGAWAELYYEMGQTYRGIGRLYDAERYLQASAAMAATLTQTWLRARLGLVSVDMRRSRYRPAFVAMTNVWAKPALRTKEVHYLYAMTLLSQRRDMDAYDALVAGLTRFGVAPRLAERDPLYRAFLDLLGRASDAHIKAFYAVLGVQLETMALRAGAEHTAALFINQRTILAQCYPYLQHEDDLRPLAERATGAGSGGDDMTFGGGDELLDDVAIEEL